MNEATIRGFRMMAAPIGERPPPTRAEIIEEARSIYAARYGHRIPEHNGCLFWAVSFNEAARNAGLDAILQAGSASFQFRTDDGKCDTHFSYEFEAGPAMLKVKQGELPEMHVWSAIRSTNEIVDLSTQYQPRQASELCGFEWEPRLRPPPYLWVGSEWLRQCNYRFVYRADALAITIALFYLSQWRRTEEGGQP